MGKAHWLYIEYTPHTVINNIKHLKITPGNEL